MIHQMSCVSPEAKLHPSVEVGPFTVIEGDVEIGEGTKIMNNVTIMNGTRIGKNCTIFPGAVIGAIPQDLKFRGEYTTVEIGDNNIIRECVTVHRGTASKSVTKIGNNCLIMAYCHVAHDCELHDYIIMSNCVQLAGEVEVDDYAIVGGGTLVHQFSHIGKNVMIQGGSHINKDIPPYVKVGHEPISYNGVNTIGLRRKNYTDVQMDEILEIYRYIYLSGLNFTDAVKRVEAELAHTEIRDEIVNFIRNSKRGIVRGNV